MNGKTHLAIGAIIGAAYSFIHAPGSGLDTMTCFVVVGGFSALAADLDGPSMLTRKLSKLSRTLRTSSIILGLSALLILGFFYFTNEHFRPGWLWQGVGGATMLTLLGLLVSRGFWRNTMVSLAGIGLGVYGYMEGWYWLIGLGIFVVIAPWLSHRGLTHTLWAVPIWGWIGFGLEAQLAIDGLGILAMLTYLSHIVADMFTPAGVKFLFPLWKKKFRLKL